MRYLGVLVVGLLLLTACGRDEERERRAAPAKAPDTTVAPKAPAAAKPEDNVRLVEVDLSVFKFTPKEIYLKVGEPVRFKATSKDTIHSFTIKDLGIDIELTPGGEQVSEAFTPQQTGRFQITCRIHSVSAYGMEGFLVVTETGEPPR
jgi:cytochrome c oxidase subunit 2